MTSVTSHLHIIKVNVELFVAMYVQVALYPTFWCLSVFDVLNLSLSVFSDNFMLFKMDVAKQAINSRSGKAIPPKVR